MPPAWSSEDRQPNEIRLSRKGVTTAPLVRPTAPRWTDRPESFHGRGRGFGRGSGPQFNSRGRFNTLGRPSPAFTAYPERSHYLPASTDTATPQGWLNPGPRKRMSSFSDGCQSKRPCLDNRSNEHSRSGLASISPPPSKNLQKKMTKGARIEIKLDLPIHCRRGVHGYHKSRRHWLDLESKRQQQEGKVIIHSEFRDREVLLHCSLQGHLHPSIRDEFLTGEKYCLSL